MRRLITAGSALLVATGIVLVLPVTGPATPEAEPVETSVTEVALGSAAEPADDVVVETPAPGAPPTLRVSRPDVAEFSLVGTTWAYDPAVVDVIVRIRARDAVGTWGPWTEIDVEDTTRDGAGAGRRGGTSPLWTGPSRGVEAELTTRSGAAPVDVRLDLVDPGTSPADAVPGPPDIQDTADAAESMPDVYSRAQWGADERLRTWRPKYAGVLKAATIHHTAGANGYAAADVAEIVRGIYRYHAVSLGWGDIGYHVLVDRFGRLWEGRSGGLASTVIGAHAGGFNTGTFGVSMIGNYDVVDTTPSMIDAVAAITAWKLSLYGVDPGGSTTLTSSGGGTSRYAAGEKVTVRTVFAHRDVGSTACPGRYGFARMAEIRRKADGDYVDVTRITARYDSDAAARAVLGAVVTPPNRTATGSGAFADYAGGSLYYSAPTGVRLVRGPVRNLWRSGGAEGGPLGFPTADVSATPDGAGVSGRFQRGSIWWTQPTGARALLGGIETLWKATGAQGGPLGYPVRSVSWLPDEVGQYAEFEGGSIYWSPATGARAMLGPIERLWRSGGAENGVLGYPTRSVSTTPDGEGQYATFEHGSIYWTPETGARAVLGPIEALWKATGAQGGVLGYPTGSVSWLPNRTGQFATFEDGAIWWSPQTGARALLGPIEDEWRSAGAEAGPLGFPTWSVSTAADGESQYAHFQNGSLWTDGTTVLELGREVRDAWVAAGADRGRLGAPTSSEEATPDGRGRLADFTGGSVVHRPETGAHLVWGPVQQRWSGEGGVEGPLGYPADDVRATADGRAEVGRFENGELWSGAATGVRLLSGPVRDYWTGLGAESSLLGLPTADVTATADGVGASGRFEGGSIWWSPGTGTRALLGEIERVWVAAGAEQGPLGYPKQAVTWLPGRAGQYATFERGSMWWTSRTGAHALSGPIEALWKSSGAQNGPLGYPTKGVSALPGGAGQVASFQGGSIWWSEDTGARAMLGPVEALWRSTGAQNGPLGLPTKSVTWLPGKTGQFATFEGGSIWWSRATGARALLGEVETRWEATGGHSGSLGLPTQSVTTSADGIGQFALFQRGGIWWKSTTGARVLTGSFLTTYRDAGAERGRLGYPTSEAYPVRGGTWQNFERGTIRRSTATGRTWVQLR